MMTPHVARFRSEEKFGMEMHHALRFGKFNAWYDSHCGMMVTMPRAKSTPCNVVAQNHGGWFVISELCGLEICARSTILGKMWQIQKTWLTGTV